MDAMPMRLPFPVLLNRLVCLKIRATWVVVFVGGLCMMLLAPSVAAQSTTTTQETFLAYRCEFEAATNQAMIYASLVDVNGKPLPRTSYTVTLGTATMAEVPPQRITVTDQTRRPALRMVLVLDTTDTMPLRDLVPVLSAQLMSKLDVNDQVAFIGVDAQITPTTVFYIDKNKLINEHMLALTPHSGDNRVFDGINQALDTLGAAQNARQVVLFITDSARKAGADQSTISELGTKARSNKTQIYPMGIHLWDDPNDDELLLLASASQGYGWIYNEDTRSNASAAQAIGERLTQLIDALNSEIVISVDMRDQVPDAQNQVRFDIFVKLDNGVTLDDQMSCPIAVLKHNLTFKEGTPTTLTTTDPVDITVTALSDLPPDQTSIVFRVNDEPVQNGDSSVFTFNTPSYQPGEYVVSAQLRDKNDNILATTENSVTISSAQNIQLIVDQGSLADFTQPMRLVVTGSANVDLPDARFTINRRSDATLVYPLGIGYAPFQKGVAQIDIPNLKTEVERLFPNIKEGETLEIRATVPGIGGVTLAQTDPPLSFLYLKAAPVVAQGSAAPVRTLTPVEAFFATISQQVLISAMLVMALLLLNLILFFRVGRARVRRMIFSPDTTEMSNRLMAVTVRRDSLKQTLVLTKRTMTLGRGSANDINLGDDTNISREHAVIMWRRGHWYYTHRKPRLRTRIEGRRIAGYVLRELEPVTELEMGETKLFFHSANQQDVSELTKTNL